MEIQKIKGHRVLRAGSGSETITAENYPLTHALLQENKGVVAIEKKDLKKGDKIMEFYFAEQEWAQYRDELAGKDYPYNGMNIYLSDEDTVALQIIKMV